MRAAFLAALLLAAAAPAARAANATVMLYRHSTLDKVNSRSSRNVAVSFWERKKNGGRHLALWPPG